MEGRDRAWCDHDLLFLNQPCSSLAGGGGLGELVRGPDRAKPASPGLCQDLETHVFSPQLPTGYLGSGGGRGKDGDHGEEL